MARFNSKFIISVRAEGVRFTKLPSQYAPQDHPDRMGVRKSRSVWQHCGSFSPATAHRRSVLVLDLNPEIRAVLFGLVIATLSYGAILALFYSP